MPRHASLATGCRIVGLRLVGCDVRFVLSFGLLFPTHHLFLEIRHHALFLIRRVIDDFELTSPGYKILFEILIKGKYESFSEIPFIFRNRQFSSSKLNFLEYYLFAKQLYVFGIQKLRE